MEHIRLSTTADIPALRRLWTLAFGDGGAYLDNFFDTYYKPERMIVLEQDGEYYLYQLVVDETTDSAATETAAG